MKQIEDNRRGEFWRFIFLYNTKKKSFGELKNCIGGGFEGIGVYMNYSYLIYVVMIFLKLKIY